MEYNFSEIERGAKDKWAKEQVYKTTNDSAKPKCYVLDMFPYPSGAGLHVGHPLGYIASDVYARYKRLMGYNVLHPMGFDAFGLPAEQYALETGQHPAVTTEKNIKRYREQLDNIGFSYDWDREVRTSDPKYYKWTQWIFLQLFHSWYDRKENKARPISELISIFEQEGNQHITCPEDEGFVFSSTEWAGFSEKEKRDALMKYRIAYQGYAQVWWCEGLGTVLANDEVVNGVSERGGFPVERKNMRQWFLRITEYAERLLNGLDSLDWSEAMKEMQRNWIGKSKGAEVRFDLSPALSEGEGGVAQASGEKDLSPALSEGEGGVAQASGEKDLSPALSEGEGGVAQERNEGKTTPGWNTAEPSLYNLIKDKRAELKNNQTEAEGILWKHIKANALGVKFRRQHVIGRFIADFVCLPKKLIIEVDGKIHEHQKEHDEQRTAYLNEKGFTVIRFTNEEIISNIDSVVEKIKHGLQEATAYDDTSLSFGEGQGEVSVFTTRPDTIFGVDFLVLAPEHELVDIITTEEQRAAVEQYKTYVKSRSERERMSEVKQVSGCFTGAYAVHPLTQKEIPIWIAEYVLAGYGTGAIMAVPSGDERDHAFAKHFNIPITNIFGDRYTGEAAYSAKTGILEDSDFVTGMSIADAAEAVITTLEGIGHGKGKVNYRLRDAGFSRQRYWGEPFPIVYVDGVPYGTDEREDLSPALSEGAGGVAQERSKYAKGDGSADSLPVELPMVEHYKPGPEGQGPLANVKDWVNISSTFGRGREEVATRETNTMPGYAGSSWYFLRYMDPHNDREFADRKATDYWNQVDLYVGGTEHAVGHLLYSRMWTKALCDLGHIGFDEPFKRLLNQGMIQGVSYFAAKTFLAVNWNYGKEVTLRFFIISLDNSKNYVNGSKFEHNGEFFEIVDKPIFENFRIKNAHHYIDTKGRISKSSLNEIFRIHNSEPDDRRIEHIIWDGKLENGEEYLQCYPEIEKMSKSKYNVVNPDDIRGQYGADTFRMYEMFLGPIDISKPWDTKGIEGVHRFLKKLWRLYADEQNGWIVTDEAPTEAELRVLHKTIKKISEDIERFSFNTSVSQFMIAVNELAALGCHKRAILQPLAIAICPYAPHIAEELWGKLGNSGSVIHAQFPAYEEKYVAEHTKNYPVAVNGKTRVEMEFALDAAQADIEQAVLANESVQKWLEGKTPKKFIYVKGKMINVVV